MEWAIPEKKETRKGGRERLGEGEDMEFPGVSVSKEELVKISSRVVGSSPKCIRKKPARQIQKNLKNIF